MCGREGTGAELPWPRSGGGRTRGCLSKRGVCVLDLLECTGLRALTFSSKFLFKKIIFSPSPSSPASVLGNNEEGAGESLGTQSGSQEGMTLFPSRCRALQGSARSGGCHRLSARPPPGTHLHPCPPGRLPISGPAAMPVPFVLQEPSPPSRDAGSSHKDNDTWGTPDSDLGQIPPSRRSVRQRRGGRKHSDTDINYSRDPSGDDRRFTRGEARQECAAVGKRGSDQHKGTCKQGWDVLEEMGEPGRAIGQQQQQHPYKSQCGKVQSSGSLVAPGPACR